MSVSTWSSSHHTTPNNSPTHCSCNFRHFANNYHLLLRGDLLRYFGKKTWKQNVNTYMRALEIPQESRRIVHAWKIIRKLLSRKHKETIPLINCCLMQVGGSWCFQGGSLWSWWKTVCGPGSPTVLLYFSTDDPQDGHLFIFGCHQSSKLATSGCFCWLWDLQLTGQPQVHKTVLAPPWLQAACTRLWMCGGIWNLEGKAIA